MHGDGLRPSRVVAGAVGVALVAEVPGRGPVGTQAARLADGSRLRWVTIGHNSW